MAVNIGEFWADDTTDVPILPAADHELDDGNCFESTLAVAEMMKKEYAGSMLKLQHMLRNAFVRSERNELQPSRPDSSGGAASLVARTGALIALKNRNVLKSSANRKWIRACLALLPTFAAVVYVGALESNRYVVESQFVIRTTSKHAGNLSFGSLLQMTGIGQSNDDSFAVEQYLQSRDAFKELLERLPLKTIYGRATVDVFSRYPSIFFGKTKEQFYNYFQWMIDVIHDGNSGITTLRVEAFTPQDANKIADTMLTLGEQTVNRMNDRISKDSIRVAQEEVDDSEQRLVDSELALTEFRDKELMIDPTAGALIEAKVEGDLAGEESKVDAQIRTIQSTSPDSPQLSSMKQEADALANQIIKEKAVVTGTNGANGLADAVSEYERLVLNQQFAKLVLTTATTSLETAKSDARRQQLYLERIVSPNLPDYPEKPERMRTIATVFAFNIIFLLVAATVVTGVREHAAGKR